VIDFRNAGERKSEQQYQDTLTLLEQTPGENFKEIRENILANPKNHSVGHKIQQWLGKLSVPNLFGFPTSLGVEDEDLNRSARSKLKTITSEAIGMPLLEGALQNIQDNPTSSTAQFQKRWLLAGADRTIMGAAGNEPAYMAYSEVFPFIKDLGKGTH
jgi:hypothetical protein